MKGGGRSDLSIRSGGIFDSNEGVFSLEYAVQNIYMQQRESFEVSSRSICNGVVRDEER